jgi:integral membrane sensor domain MASE1
VTRGRSVLVALVLVALVPGVAGAHHEVLLTEVAAGLSIWIPVCVLAALGLIDRVRMWWRDGARVALQVGRWHVYSARGLAGSWLPTVQVFESISRKG